MPDSPAPTAPRPRTFRLLEVLVAMSILVTLAGLLVPYTDRVAERTRIDGATRDIALIAAALRGYVVDAPTWMRGAGAAPAGCPISLRDPAVALDRLALPHRRTANGDTPVIVLEPDPWGSSYLIALRTLAGEARRSAVVCAGPDRALHTPDDLQRAVN